MWMPETLLGDFKLCSDIDPENRRVLKVNEVYKTGESKGMSMLMKQMFLKSKADFEMIEQMLKPLKRSVVPTPMDGECFYKSILNQIDAPADYTTAMLRKQLAFHGCKYYEVFEDLKPYLLDQTYESFLKNTFYGYSYAGIAESVILSHMWNVRISIVAADLPPQHVFHDGSECELVLVHNGREGSDGHFSGTSKFYYLLIELNDVNVVIT